MKNSAGMTIIVKTITRIVAALIFLYGLYIVLHGHLTPGGGFAGGVIIASSLALFTLAYGMQVMRAKISEGANAFLESIGMLLFLAIASLGLAAGYFFKNLLAHGRPLDLWSAGIIPLCNIAIAIEVFAGLFGIFAALVMFGKKGRTKE